MSLISIICKKNRVIFFTIYPLHIETLKVLEKLIKKIVNSEVSMVRSRVQHCRGN